MKCRIPHSEADEPISGLSIGQAIHRKILFVVPTYPPQIIIPHVYFHLLFFYILRVVKLQFGSLGCICFVNSPYK